MSVSVALFVCLSVCECVSVCLSASISPKLHARSSPIFVYGRGAFVFWQRCDTKWTSGFLYDVIFAHIGPYGGMSIPLQQVTSCCAQANAPAASCWLHRVLDEGGHLD